MIQKIYQYQIWISISCRPQRMQYIQLILTMGKGPATPLEDYTDPLKFYNHGDNPAMKNFMKIAMENGREGKVIDHRTFFIDKGQKFLLARNWDDFLQRDLQCTTFPRTLGIFVCNTMVFIAFTRIARNLLPIGRFGIRSVSQTSLWHNFGPLGVAGALGIFAVGAYTEYKTCKFTLHKFYRHVLMGERNWFLEEKHNTSVYGTYGFSDNMLGNENNFQKTDAQKYACSLEDDIAPSFRGAYGKNSE